MDPPPIQYVKTSDGYHIAYTDCGSGIPLVFMPSGLSHVQLSWTGGHRAWLEGLSQRFRLVTYDSRGQGLSSRGLPSTFAFADFRLDLEAILEALGLQKFVLLGSVQFGHIAAQYAAEHPERLRSLILVHCSVAMEEYPIPLWLDVARGNWDFFLSTILLAGTSPGNDLSIERFRQMTTQADWLTSVSAFHDSDISEILPRIRTPTLILHARGFRHLPAASATRLAALLPDARLCITDGANAYTDPQQGISAIEQHLQNLSETASQRPTTNTMLSQREIEVLRLLAAGLSNQQIADELVISRNTIRRHVSNVFDKTGVANRVQAVAYARDHGIG